MCEIQGSEGAEKRSVVINKLCDTEDVCSLCLATSAFCFTTQVTSRPRGVRQLYPALIILRALFTVLTNTAGSGLQLQHPISTNRAGTAGHTFLYDFIEAGVKGPISCYSFSTCFCHRNTRALCRAYKSRYLGITAFQGTGDFIRVHLILNSRVL